MHQFFVLKHQVCEYRPIITLVTNKILIYPSVRRRHPLPRHIKHQTQQQRTADWVGGVKENYFTGLRLTKCHFGVHSLPCVCSFVPACVCVCLNLHREVKCKHTDAITLLAWYTKKFLHRYRFWNMYSRAAKCSSQEKGKKKNWGCEL